jgi:hypothetical protein
VEKHAHTTSALLLAACLSAATPALATGSLSSVDHTPLELRVALSLGPDRTSLWTQLRVDSEAGQLAVVIPAAPGAALDWATPAWFEALEVASAPRVLPPEGVDAACPGQQPAPLIDLVGDSYHAATLTPLELLVLDDAASVASWAVSHQLHLSSSMYDNISALSGYRFVLLRFDVPDAVSLTPALRVVGPGPNPVLPLVLSEAQDEPMLITSLTLAEGSTILTGSSARIDLDRLSFDVAAIESNYAALRDSALWGGSWLREMSSRQAMTLPIAAGEHRIDPLPITYFTRAALYQGGVVDAPNCVARALDALARPLPIGTSCPAASLGWIGAPAPCQEGPVTGVIDPSELRCAPLADDLAIALSGQVADAVWLTRFSTVVPPGGNGNWRTVLPSNDETMHPVHTAAIHDVSGCDDPSATGSSSSSGGNQSSGVGSDGAGQTVTVDVPVYAVHSSCGARTVGDVLYYTAVAVTEEEDAPDAYYQEEDCSGDSSGAYTPVYDNGSSGSGSESDADGLVGGDNYENDDCEGNSDESYDSGDDCGGDSDESYDSGDDCSGDSGESYDSGGGDCGGDSAGGGGDCSYASRRRRPRMSIVVLALLAFVAPLRRLTRRRNTAQPTA